MPKAIVLDGSEIVRPFYEKVKNLPVAPTVLFDNTEMLNSILQAISHEHIAAIQLEMDVLDMVSEMVGTAWSADVDVVAYGMVEFGQRLMQMLQYMRAYRNGFLHYQHGQWLGMDIILHRLEAPALDAGFHNRHWRFGSTPAMEFEETSLIAGVVRDPSGVYTNLTEDPNSPNLPLWVKAPHL